MSTPAAKCLGELLEFLPHRHFTAVQEAVIPALFRNDHNCLVVAPTGSGKTVLLEVAMLRLFRHVLAPQADTRTEMTPRDGGISFSAGPLQQRKWKAVYICPIKALANEKYEDWRAQFPTLTVVIETGDQQQQGDHLEHSCATATATGDGRARDDIENMACVSKADILVTTPERWDSITRRWKEREVMGIVNSVGLLLLDEVHTVQEERGAAMEAIVSRVKAIQASSMAAHQGSATGATLTRIIAISGTLPNSRDLAEWLQVSPEMTFTFASTDRPVPLTIRVIGYAHDSPNPFAFHRFLSFKIFALVQQFSEGKPTLVFCASRKETISSAQRIVEDIRDAAARQGQLAQLQPSADAQQLTQQATDKQLRSCLMMGVGFHHAAMAKEDRQLVERMFREQYIAVICATTTLALGVNLPAHLVVVKGTAFFSNGRCQDMPVSEVMQMCGRAGRPGFDTHGMALVLTMQRSVHLYETLASGAVTLTCVESHLHCHMIEHVNAEVALRTIHSFQSAMDWVKTTFFWIRLRKCPSHYGLEFASRADEVEFSAEAFVEALMERVLRVLMEEGCVRLSHRDASVLSSAREMAASVVSSNMDAIRYPSAVFEATRLGRAMSRMYILFDTVCTLNAELKARGAASATGGVPDDESVEDACLGTMDIGCQAATQTASTNATEVPMDSRAKMDTSTEGAQPQSGSTDATVRSVRRQMVPFTLREVLELLCHCQELVEVRLRQGDRGPLNEVNKRVKYPLNSGRRGGREVREDWQKAYVLVQAHIGLLPFTEVSLRNDSLRLWAVVPRVSRFLEEYAWAATTSYSLSLHANVLARCIARRVWPDGLVLRQLKHVSDSVAKALLRSGYHTFQSLGGVDARHLEVLCSRLPPFGTQVLREVRRLPRISLDIRLKASVAEVDGTHDGRRAVSGVVQLTLPPSVEAASREGLLDAGRGELSATASSKAPGGKPQVLSDEVALEKVRVLLLVGIPSDDCVLLKRFVPLSAFGSPSATWSTSTAAATSVADEHRPSTLCFSFVCPPSVGCIGGSGRRGRRIEARCLVLRIVGMDTVTVQDEASLVDHDRAASESMHSSAQTPAADACAPGPAPKHSALLPHTSAPQTELSVQVAAEARTKFNELLEDFKCIASVGETQLPPRSAPPQSSASRKRARGDHSLCRTAEEEQQKVQIEVGNEIGIAATLAQTFSISGSTLSPSVPDLSDLRDADLDAYPGAAAAQASEEGAAADGSSPNPALYSPAPFAGHAVRVAEPLCDQTTPLHLSEFPPKSALRSPSPPHARHCNSPQTGAAAHRQTTQIRLHPRDSPPASRPHEATGASPRACFLAGRGEGPYDTPHAAPMIPVHPRGTCDTSLYATVPANKARVHSRCVAPWSRQSNPLMGEPAVALSSRFVVRVPPPHASAVRQRGDDMQSRRCQRNAELEQQETLRSSLNPHRTTPDVDYAVTGVHGEWCQPRWLPGPRWMDGVVTSAHPYPYCMTSMMVQPGHYGPTPSWPSGLGHPQGHWERVVAAPVSHFAPQQPPFFFASQPPFHYDEESQQMWQRQNRQPSYPPSQVPSESLPHQPPPSTQVPVLKTQPWPRPLPTSVIARREWHPFPSTQPPLAPPSLWTPLSNTSQQQRVGMMSSGWRPAAPPADTPVRRGGVSVARPTLSSTIGGGNFAPNVRYCSPVAASSWWQ
ncbi:hypothetical protein CUR178_02262 [Leishmania enriettii]|uniref:DNA 3'-5' helicase n=1 Tax=Leishmania enriettii TaxID=5663 RepID=A0A836G9Y2_LEIEN|nr:hypothetical protein CUR178_02262 [Leishmania enriettii]